MCYRLETTQAQVTDQDPHPNVTNTLRNAGVDSAGGLVLRGPAGVPGDVSSKRPGLRSVQLSRRDEDP